MDARETVAALRSADPAGLRSVYDTYGLRLYDYALGMLHDREAAEDAVHDALLVAVDRSRGLREPDRLTAWLYAITRNECLRQARRSRVAARPRHIDERDATVFFGVDLQLEQARAWVRDAAAGLTAGKREALDLTLRHGLREQDLATVLGLKPPRARSLVLAAQESLDGALDTLLTARAGLDECGELNALLAGWDGLFTRDIHERVSRHVGRCSVCASGARRRDAASALYAELPFAALPRALFDRVLATASVPDRVAYRGEIAEPFQRSGFPVSLDRQPGRRRVINWAAALALIALVGGLWYALRPGTTVRTVGEPVAPPGIASITPDVSRSPPTPSASPSSPSPSPSSPSPSPSPSPSAAPKSPTPSPDASRANRGLDRGVRVSAALQDSTTGCPSRWRATVTTFVEGTEAREATFLWGRGSTPEREVEMNRAEDGLYQVTVDGLPMDETIVWRVDVVTADGNTASTEVEDVRHRRRC